MLGIGLASIFIFLIIKSALALWNLGTDKNSDKKKVKNKPKLDLTALAHWNLQSYGYMSNATGFIVGYGMLIWLFYNSGDYRK